MRPSNPSARSASAALAPARPAPAITYVSGMARRQRQELAARARVVAHEPVQRRGDRRRPRLLHAADRHAHVLGLEHDADTLRRELALQPAGDLRGQPLLDLQRAGEVIDHPSELRQPDDPLAGDVADMGDAAERQQVVLAQGVERDVARYDELVVTAVVRERGGVEVRGRQQLGVHGGHPARRIAPRLVVEVDAERGQEVGRRALGRGDWRRLGRKSKGMGHDFFAAAPAHSLPREVRTARRATPTVMLAVMAVTDDALLAALRGPDRDAAVAELHALLLRAARFELGRRRVADDDLAMEAADDALMAVLGKLDDFRGASRFTTWAYKFALLEAGVKARRRAWRGREVQIDEERWPEIPDTGLSAHDRLEQQELLRALQHAVRTELTPHQREVFVALALNGVPIDVLAERLGSTRGALYKTLHDARRKLREVTHDDR